MIADSVQSGLGYFGMTAGGGGGGGTGEEGEGGGGGGERRGGGGVGREGGRGGGGGGGGGGTTTCPAFLPLCPFHISWSPSLSGTVRDCWPWGLLRQRGHSPRHHPEPPPSGEGQSPRVALVVCSLGLHQDLRVGPAGWATRCTSACESPQRGILQSYCFQT